MLATAAAAATKGVTIFPPLKKLSPVKNYPSMKVMLVAAAAITGVPRASFMNE